MNEKIKIDAPEGTYRIVEGPTPHGGVVMVAYFYDAKDRRCVESKSKTTQILEFDDDGECIFSIISKG